MHAFIESGTHWAIFNFVVFVGLLAFVLRKPLKSFWADRRRLISSDMNESARLAKQAEERHQSYKVRLDKIESETGQLTKDLTDEGQMLKERILEETKAWQLRMKTEAARVGEQEVQKAKNALQKEAVLLATEFAEKLLKNNIRSEDELRINAESIQSLGGKLQ